jgi:hypothetical protein
MEKVIIPNSHEYLGLNLSSRIINQDEERSGVQMEASYEEIKEALGGKEPEEVLKKLLVYVQRIKPRTILATTKSEEDENWDRIETDDDDRL